MDPTVLNEAIAVAVKAKQQSYCPYSKFPVGCALICSNNQIIKGVNVENASFGLTICAERSAICAAVSNGLRDFKAIVVSCNTADFVWPCGSCRQVISEFGNLDVYTINQTGQVDQMRIADLLPKSFCQEDLHTAAQP